MAKRIDELTPTEAEKRRKQRKDMYHRNPERQRGYSAAYRRRKAVPGKELGVPRPRNYDAQDYAEEWQFLTDAGLLSTEIIDRSMPSKAWFKKHVTHLVKYANCPSCGRKYLVAKSGTLLICGKDCPKCYYTDDGRVSRTQRALELSYNG